MKKKFIFIMLFIGIIMLVGGIYIEKSLKDNNNNFEEKKKPFLSTKEEAKAEIEKRKGTEFNFVEETETTYTFVSVNDENFKVIIEKETGNITFDIKEPEEVTE